MITCARANKGEEQPRERERKIFFSDCKAITIHRETTKYQAYTLSAHTFRSQPRSRYYYYTYLLTIQNSPFILR